MPVTGGCLCQAVRYTIHAEPIVIRECWCRVCQYLGAGSSAVNACFPTAAVQVEGALHALRLDAPTAATACTAASARLRHAGVLGRGVAAAPGVRARRDAG